jgi:hypothetical protein
MAALAVEGQVRMEDVPEKVDVEERPDGGMIENPVDNPRGRHDNLPERQERTQNGDGQSDDP